MLAFEQLEASVGRILTEEERDAAKVVTYGNAALYVLGEARLKGLVALLKGAPKEVIASHREAILLATAEVMDVFDREMKLVGKAPRPPEDSEPGESLRSEP